MEFRTTVLHSAGTELNEVATEVRTAFDELLAALRADGGIPRDDDVSAMIAEACAAIQEIATGSVETAVAALGGNGERLASMAAAYEGAETDTRSMIGGLPWG